MQQIVIHAPTGNHSSLTLSNEKGVSLPEGHFRYVPPSDMKISAPLG
jgi:hypothetical protein